MKKIISLILTIFIIASATAISSSAAVVDNTVMPLWNNIEYVSTNIGFGDNNDGNASGGCIRQSGVELVEGTISVFMNYNGAWFRLGTASKSVETGTLAVGVDFYCQSGVQYRADFTVTAYRNGVAETYTDVVYRTCP